VSANKIYKVVVVGMGKRGKHHALAFKNNPRFELAGICTRDVGKLAKAATELGVSRTSSDPLAIAKEIRPDVFCFCTPPQVRLDLIQAGIDSGAKLIAYEKPMAMSTNEAMDIRRRVQAAGVKTVVSHQHRYGKHYQKVKEIIASDAIGRVHTVYGHAVGWMLHICSHLVDYMRWYNSNARAEWVDKPRAGTSWRTIILRPTISADLSNLKMGFAELSNAALERPTFLKLIIGGARTELVPKAQRDSPKC